MLWQTIIHLTFVASAVSLALIDRFLSPKSNPITWWSQTAERQSLVGRTGCPSHKRRPDFRLTAWRETRS